MNPTIITGWIAAILLFFNFGTCLAMPWVNKKFRECDLKNVSEHKCHAISLCKYHKPLVILSIISIIVHIVFSLIY